MAELNSVNDSHSRSIVKALTWRATGSLDTFVLSFFITGSLHLASGIAASELVTKIVLFWLHERVWNKIKWGKCEEDYVI